MCQYRYVAPQQGKLHKHISAVQNSCPRNFNDFHFTVHFRGFSQTTQTKAMIAMQEDHILNVLFKCEFFCTIYASQFTNCVVAERNDVYLYCIAIGLQSF
jgi:hypothetical protein